MENITINEIVLATGGKLIVGNTDEVINSVSIDSRKIKAGALFVPIIGENVDGHNYIQNAFENGAKVSLIQKNMMQVIITGSAYRGRIYQESA